MDKEKEMRVVTLMIKKYCKGNHGTKKGVLCPECTELLNYVEFRRRKCPFDKNKPFCSNCKIHCYKPEMREKIRKVMRYSGPRIVLDHPILATMHLTESKSEKKKLEKEVSK